jgi:hypothetical protein
MLKVFLNIHTEPLVKTGRIIGSRCLKKSLLNQLTTKLTEQNPLVAAHIKELGLILIIEEP